MAPTNAISMSARRAEPGRYPGRRQSGVALITMLLIVALLTAIVSRLSLSNEIWLRQVQGGAALAQAGQASRAGQHWVTQILEQDDPAFDGHTDLWAQPLPPIAAGWGSLDGWIEDRQGRFNLNNLVDDQGQPVEAAVLRFRRLLILLELNPDLAQAVSDWIDPDRSRAGAWGAEDGFYMGLSPPYLAANRPFRDSEELRLVRGVDADTWRRLEPHVAALPGGTPVNVNTASPEVLAAVITGWGEPARALATALRWSAETDRQPATELQGFLERAVPEADAETQAALAVGSGFFMAHTRVGFDNVVYRMATLYQRREGVAGILRHRQEL